MGWCCKRVNKQTPMGYFLGQVLSPTNEYNGQKLMRLVAKKTPPSTNSTKPAVPATVPVKYNTANNAANTMRMTRSTAPMFFFMLEVF